MPKVKKDNSVVHPNSRKALQLARKVYHGEKLNKRKEETNLKLKLKLTKLKWFKENIDVSKSIYTTEDVKELVERYLRRFDGEMEKEEVPKTLKRHLSTSTFQDFKTKFLIEKEKQEYEAGGLEIPQLMQKKPYDIFKAWNCDIDLLPAITTINVSMKQLEKSGKKDQSIS